MTDKAIPARRDRLQSEVLVCIVGALLATSGIWFLLLGATILNFRSAVWVAALLCSTFGCAVWALRAATPAASFWGALIALEVTWSTGGASRLPFRSALFPLITLFLLTFLATRVGRRRKQTTGLAEQRRGRTASQILANLGALGLLSTSSFFVWPPSVLVLQVLLTAALCEATADTVSSEIGQAFGGTPVLITTLRRAAPGTDGAISLLGTAAGIAAAALVALSGLWAMHLSPSAAVIALMGGIAGLLFDSLLGATVERRGWLNNDLVNFASTVFAAFIAWLLVRRV